MPERPRFRITPSRPSRKPRPSSPGPRPRPRCPRSGSAGAVDDRKLTPANGRIVPDKGCDRLSSGRARFEQIEPAGPRCASVRCWVRTALTPALAQGHRAPTLMLEVVTAAPNMPVRRHMPTSEKVIFGHRFRGEAFRADPSHDGARTILDPRPASAHGAPRRGARPRRNPGGGPRDPPRGGSERQAAPLANGDAASERFFTSSGARTRTTHDTARRGRRGTAGCMLAPTVSRTSPSAPHSPSWTVPGFPPADLVRTRLPQPLRPPTPQPVLMTKWSTRRKRRRIEHPLRPRRIAK